MDVTITKFVDGGRVDAIPSKSAAHRMLIAASLSGLDVSGICEDVSKDLKATTDCLINISKEKGALDCKESGSTLRFILPVCGALGIVTSLNMEGRLAQRPMRELEEQLTSHGTTIRRKDNTIEVSGQLKAGEYVLPGGVSSQYVTGLLFALPLLQEDSKIIVEGKLQSKAYVDMTLQVLASAGIKIREDGNEDKIIFHVPGRQEYSLKSFRREDIEGDWSNSAVWIAADEIISRKDGDSRIKVEGLDYNSLQADKAIISVIEALRDPFEARIDVSQCPDLAPVIAALACSRNAGEVTCITNAARLRMKESDRIKAICDTINGVGGNAEEKKDEIVITATPLKGGAIDSHNDHRIVMLGSLLAGIAEGEITIKNAEAIEKSYPNFFEDFRKLGGKTEVKKQG